MKGDINVKKSEVNSKLLCSVANRYVVISLGSVPKFLKILLLNLLFGPFWMEQENRRTVLTILGSTKYRSFRASGDSYPGCPQGLRTAPMCPTYGIDLRSHGFLPGRITCHTNLNYIHMKYIKLIADFVREKN